MFPWWGEVFMITKQRPRRRKYWWFVVVSKTRKKSIVSFLWNLFGNFLVPLKHFDDCFGRFRSIWNDTFVRSWTHLAFSLSWWVAKQQRQQRYTFAPIPRFGYSDQSLLYNVMLHSQKSNILGKKPLPVPWYCSLKIKFFTFSKN